MEEYEETIRTLLNDAAEKLSPDEYLKLLSAVNFETWHRQHHQTEVAKNEDL